jgi:hypothetical protein
MKSLSQMNWNLVGSIYGRSYIKIVHKLTITHKIKKIKIAKNKNNQILSKLYTFSFEINESRLSGTRCLIQDVVSPHCGDKRMARRCTRHSLPNYFDMTLWVAIATSCDAVSSRNRQDLIQSLVPPHYVCNKFI